MTCPFPGMDPYIESSGSWPDFHDSLIAVLRGELNRVIRPRYAAMSQTRLVVVEHEREIYPDVALLRRPESEGRRGVVMPDADPAIVLEAARSSELLRQPYLQIIDPKDRGRVVTTIEVLSPNNKIGKGLAAYRAKLDESWEAGVNVVEIDLLKGGESILREEYSSRLPASDSPFVIAVSRCTPPRYEVYPAEIRVRLPRIAVPLSADDQDVVLDLQSACKQVWELGAYPEMLQYQLPLEGDWSAEDRAWCKEQIAKAGIAAAS